VYFYYPAWSKPWEENWVPSADSPQDVITALRGSEHRWRSISVHSGAWSPIQEFLGACITPSLPALESISFKKLGETPISPTPQSPIEWPALFGGNGTLVPKLREVTLRRIHVDWTPAATSFQNLREFVINHHSYEAGPILRQFSALFAASLMLETLGIPGCHPNPDDSPAQAPIPLVHLLALKHLG